MTKFNYGKSKGWFFSAFLVVLLTLLKGDIHLSPLWYRITMAIFLVVLFAYLLAVRDL